MKLFCSSTLLILLAFSLAGSNAHADKIDDFIKDITAKDLMFVEFDGVLMENNFAQKQMVVLEKQIVTVDEKIGDYHLQTIIKDRFGKTSIPALIKKGSRVFVRGISNPDKTIMAREIYEIAPGSSVDKYKSKIADWQPVKR